MAYNPSEPRDKIGRWASATVGRALSKGKDIAKKITPHVKQHNESKRAAIGAIHHAASLYALGVTASLAGAHVAKAVNDGIGMATGNGSSHKNTMSTNYVHPKPPHRDPTGGQSRTTKGEWTNHPPHKVP